MPRINTKTRQFKTISLVLFIFLLAAGTGFGQTASDRYPDEGWMRFTDVKEAGFDPAKLEAARVKWEKMPSSAFLVIADGAVVAAWGDVGRRFMCHSVRKSFLSALYGIYWDRGEIELNKTLADLGIDDDPDPLLDTEKQARILDLLKARSGVFHPAAYAGRTDSRPRGSEGPGRYFAYNNWDFNTAATILMRETGADVFEAFDQYFGRPLKMEDWRISDGYYHYERDKSQYPAYPFRMSARDAARFGLLFARYGMWKDGRILSEHWVNRSSALYSIDNRVFGYGFYWWIAREPRFAKYGMYSALGVGNQMIAVLPKIDMVFVNRANTYEGESTPATLLLGLIDEVLKARTGTSAENPALAPLEVASDPKITAVPKDRLAEFVGKFKYPPEPLGLPSRTELKITAGEGHLMSYSPVSGTFKLYLQNDGTLHEEDSYERYFPIRDETGSIAGIADVGRIVQAIITAAGNGDGDRAARLLEGVEGEDNLQIGVASIIVDLFGDKEPLAERAVRQISERFEPDKVEREINSVGYRLIRGNMRERALEVFVFNTRVFPEAWNTWDSLSEAHLGLGNIEEAVRVFSRSLELNPSNVRREGRFVEAALIAACEGDNNKAGRLLKAVEGKKTLRIRMAGAVVDLFGGKGNSAEQAIRQLSERFKPVRVEREINEVGNWLMRRNMGERALELLELNTRLFPVSSNAWNSLGEAHYNLGHMEEAVKAYKKSLELNPDNKNAEKMIAFIEGGNK
ncbi:MAG: serine hydrolase [Candidatus Aminicenantes bacterium]|nr:serine hydrolase [Candidatus Aminicenantes bacterium]